MVAHVWVLTFVAFAFAVGIGVGLLWTCRNSHGEHSNYDPAFSAAAVIDRVIDDRAAYDETEYDDEPEPAEPDGRAVDPADDDTQRVLAVAVTLHNGHDDDADPGMAPSHLTRPFVRHVARDVEQTRPIKLPAGWPLVPGPRSACRTPQQSVSADEPTGKHALREREPVQREQIVTQKVHQSNSR